MLNLTTMWQQIRESDFKIKNFYFNIFIYFVAMIASTIYVYARLDYVRSYALPKEIHQKEKTNQIGK